MLDISISPAIYCGGREENAEFAAALSFALIHLFRPKDPIPCISQTRDNVLMRIQMVV